MVGISVKMWNMDTPVLVQIKTPTMVNYKNINYLNISNETYLEDRDLNDIRQ